MLIQRLRTYIVVNAGEPFDPFLPNTPSFVPNRFALGNKVDSILPKPCLVSRAFSLSHQEYCCNEHAAAIIPHGMRALWTSL